MEPPEKPRTLKQRVKLLSQAIRVSREVENDQIQPGVKVYSNDLFIYSITVSEDEQLCYLAIGINHDDKGEPSGYDQLLIDTEGNIRKVTLLDKKEEQDLANDMLLATIVGDQLLTCVHKCAVNTRFNRK